MKIFHYQNVESKDADEGASKLKVRWLKSHSGSKNVL